MLTRKEAIRIIHSATEETELKPIESWDDLIGNLKTELPACPFCGGKCDPEEVGYTKGNDPEVHHSPGCIECGATVGTIEQWCSRTPDTAQKGIDWKCGHSDGWTEATKHFDAKAAQLLKDKGELVQMLEFVLPALEREAGRVFGASAALASANALLSRLSLSPEQDKLT